MQKPDQPCAYAHVLMLLGFFFFWSLLSFRIDFFNETEARMERAYVSFLRCGHDAAQAIQDQWNRAWPSSCDVPWHADHLFYIKNQQYGCQMNEQLRMASETDPSTQLKRATFFYQTPSCRRVAQQWIHHDRLIRLDWIHELRD